MHDRLLPFLAAEWLCFMLLQLVVKAEWKPGKNIPVETVARENALIDAEEAALRETAHYIESKLADRCANMHRCISSRCSVTTNGPWVKKEGQCSTGYGVMNYCTGCGGTFGRVLNFGESYIR